MRAYNRINKIESAKLEVDRVASAKSLCVIKSQNEAVEQYKTTYCLDKTSYSYNAEECSNGTYLTGHYDNYYKRCLQSNGIEQ